MPARGALYRRDGLVERAPGGLHGGHAPEPVGVQLCGQVEHRVGRVEVLLAPVPVGEAAHFDPAVEDRGQGTVVAGLDGAVDGTLGSRHALQALLLLGPQVHVVLEELAEDLARVGGEAVLQFRVGHGGRLRAPQEADDLFEELTGTLERPS